MDSSSPHFPYWGTSPEGGTRITYLNAPDSLADVNDIDAQVDQAVSRLKKLSNDLEHRHPTDRQDDETEPRTSHGAA